MKFGDTFGRNKSGEYGFWSRFTFKPTDRVYNEEEASGNTLSEVSVGAGKIWVPGDKQKWPAFSALWASYPHKIQNPSGDRYYDNENCCAIRLSYAMRKAGIDLSSYKGNKTSDGYVRSADGLRDWIKNNMESSPEILSYKDFKDKYWQNDDAQGVVWMDLPGDVNHTDLFDGSKGWNAFPGIFGGGRYYFTTIWFWKLK